MPTVLRKDGFQVMIYVDDHEPPHIHARRDKAVVIVNLGVQGGAPSLRSAKHASATVQRDALRLVSEHHDFLRDEWRRIHG